MVKTDKHILDCSVGMSDVGTNQRTEIASIIDIETTRKDFISYLILIQHVKMRNNMIFQEERILRCDLNFFVS